ncbi:MAG: YIP1 family protein [Candidatus Aenigmarchaeota archaeon]|nr:YIP1 family protein [Candidatus Aenigmarchaeota archaeon]
MDFKTLLFALLMPFDTFRHITKDASLQGSIKLILIGGTLAGILDGLRTILQPDSFSFVNFLHLSDTVTSSGNAALFLGEFILAFLFVLLGSVIFSGLCHIFAKILSGKGCFTTQLYLVALYTVPIVIVTNLISFISSINIYGIPLIYLFEAYYFYPLTAAIHEAHRFSILKAILSWALPAAILLIIAAIFLIKITIHIGAL